MMKIMIMGRNVVLTIMVIMLLFSVLSIRVSGSNQTEVTNRAYFHELEMTFLDVLDNRLQEYGYANCGLTLNSIINSDGTRTYYVQIHHLRMAEMDGTEWEELTGKLSDIPFPADGCSITYELVL